MAHFNIDNAVGPFSRATKYKAPGGAFYIFPHNDDHPDGWGRPYVDDSGNPVEPPGTPVSAGGTDPLRKYAWDVDEDQWGVVRNPGDWVYGNIDWRGTPVVTPNQTKAVKISYHGPQTRYFPDGRFAYGSEDKHNEIYANGAYLAVAPYPVLGAAYYNYEDPVSLETTSYLVVICKRYLEDRLLIKEVPTPVAPASMTEDKRSEMMELWSNENPTGWREILVVPRVTYDGGECGDAETPWFFNQSGNEAQCIRRMQKKYNNGQKEVTETGCFRFKIIISNPNQASFLNLRNTDGFTAKMAANKESYPSITANHLYRSYNQGNFFSDECAICPQPSTLERGGDNWRTDHEYAVDFIKVTADIDGEYEVAVDYYDDVEIVGKIKYDIAHRIKKYYRYCVDHKSALAEGVKREWNVDGGASGITYDQDTIFWDRPFDGRRWEFWAWYDGGGNPTGWVQCNACLAYPNEPNIDTAIVKYLEAGGSIPPDTDFNVQYQLRSFSLRGSLSLQWDHPADTNSRVLYLYTTETGTIPRYYGTSYQRPNETLVKERIDFTAQIQHLDMRIPQGPFVVFRSEQSQRDQLGVIPLLHPHTKPGESTRYWEINSATNSVWNIPWNPYSYPPNYYAGYKDPVTGAAGSSSGPYDTYVPENQHHYEYYTYCENGRIRETIRYAYIDPFSDPEDVKLVALQEAENYFVYTEKENMSLDDMQAWNPVGSSLSNEIPNSVDGNHDWRRRDFNWEYEYRTIEGAYLTSEELLSDGYEPHIDKAASPLLFGNTDWPVFWSVLGEGGADIVGGFSWLEDRGVALSFRYLKGNEPFRPVTDPMEDALKEVHYANYVTEGDLENDISPADRFYPIGVE